jgi:hypothetical protein
MTRKLLLKLLVIPTALFASKIQAWLSGDAKSNITTGRQLFITVGFLVGFYILAVLLETPRALALNWRWHRYWFLRDIVNRRQPTVQRIFQGLNQDKEAALAEVLENGKRRNLLALLMMKMTSLNPVPRIFITGEGGSGKTTTMEQLTLSLAQVGAKRWWAGKSIPVLVRMGSVSSGKLLDNVRELMDDGSSSSKVLGNGFDVLLKKGRITLLIDSVDESLGQNPNAFREVLELIEDNDYKLAPFIVSGRRGEYERRLPAFVESLNIEELGDEAVLYICTAHANKKTAQSADEILSTLRGNGLLDPGGLARNPFWLKLILEGGTFENNKPKISMTQSKRFSGANGIRPVKRRDGNVILILTSSCSKPERLSPNWPRKCLSVIRVSRLKVLMHFVSLKVTFPGGPGSRISYERKTYCGWDWMRSYCIFRRLDQTQTGLRFV